MKLEDRQLTEKEFKVWMEFKEFLNTWQNSDLSTGDTASYLEFFYEKLFKDI